MIFLVPSDEKSSLITKVRLIFFWFKIKVASHSFGILLEFILYLKYDATLIFFRSINSYPRFSRNLTISQNLFLHFLIKFLEILGSPFSSNSDELSKLDNSFKVLAVSSNNSILKLSSPYFLIEL